MSQIKKKFVGNNEIGAAKVRLENNTALRGRNVGDTADIDIIKVNASNVPEFSNLPQATSDPSAGNDLTRKSWADTQLGNKQSTSEKGNANGYASLDGTGKVPTSELPASVIGGVNYQGTWNATTNTPTLASGVGTQGYYYVVSVAGTTSLDGIAEWAVGDWAIYNGTAWEKVDNTDSVTSVNGATGAVVLDTDDISEGTNKYYATSLFNTDLATKDTDDLSEGSSNLYYATSLFNTDLATKDTDDLSEGATNKYYSSSLFDTDLAAADTDDLSEGAANFYYTAARFNTSFSGKDTDGLSEGSSNLYYATSLFNTDLATKDTDDLSEGATNKYYSSTLFDSDFSGKSSDDLSEGSTNKYALTWGKEKKTLAGGDITAQYIDLAQEVDVNSLSLVIGGIMQQVTDDYTLSVEASKTRVTFVNDLATGGNAELIAGDILYFQYQY